MEQNHEVVWKRCLDIIQDNLANPQCFKTWFEPIKPLRLHNNVLTIQVPSRFFYEWLEENYIDLIKRTIRRELGTDGRLQYSIIMDMADSFQVHASSGQHNHTQNQPIPIPISGHEPVKIDPWLRAGLPIRQKVRSNLNDTYTFDNFIEGDCNRLARSAGYAIAENPGKNAFNPMFVHANIGLGKTHLLHAIGLQTKQFHPEKTVLYVTSEEFTQQYTEAARSNSRNDFLYFYQSIDVLLIDDIHKLSGRQGTQDQLFHIFNHLHQNGKQIILASDKSLLDLIDIEARLLSRFKWGLACEMTEPDAKTRVDILKSKILNNGGEQIPNEVIEYIAYSVGSNVRELEGILNSLLAHAVLNKQPINAELARELVDKFVKNSAKDISIDYIKNIVCDYFNISIDDMVSKTRKRDIVQARQLAMYFSKKHTKASLATIGQQCGNKDHATVLYAYKLVENLMDTNRQFKGYVDILEKKIKM